MSQPNSPRGRGIAYVEGDASAVEQRGRDIKELGDGMIASAALLQRVADAQDGQQGKAVDKLREVVGDSHGLLKQAGQLYAPTGPILEAYGSSLGSVQPLIRLRVDNCTTYWDEYVALPGSVDPRGTGGAGQPEADSPEAETQADQDAAKLAAYELWEDEAVRFDGHYDTWEDAFELAAGQIGDVLDGKVEDGFWDHVDKFVEWVQFALAIAGIVLAVLAIVIGGPIIAALAAIVAIATLAFTLYQFIRGDKGGWDLALAVIGVIPFGKIGMLWNKGGASTFLKSTIKNFDPGTYKKGLEGFTEVMSSSNKWKTFVSGGDGILSMPKGERGLSIFTGLVMGKSETQLTDMFTQHFTNLSGSRTLVRVLTAPLSFTGFTIEMLHAIPGQALKYNSWFSTVTGGTSWQKQVKIPDTLIGDIPILDVIW